MHSPTPLSSVDVVILAGGLGTRVRDVLHDTPKVLAPVAGRPLLDLLLAWLAAHGARRVVLSLGHLADRVLDWLARHGGAHGIELVCRVEPEPRGTAGALRFVRTALHSDPVLVMNGDTLLSADLGPFVAAHRVSGAEASILCTAVEDAARFGRVELGDDRRVRRFAEKRPGQGTVSAGVYLLTAAFLDRLAASGAASLERDILERLPPGTVHGFVTDTGFLDIGTPESLALAAGPPGAPEHSV